MVLRRCGITSTTGAFPSRLRGQASPSALSAPKQRPFPDSVASGCSQLAGEQKPLCCRCSSPAREPLPACAPSPRGRGGSGSSPASNAWVLPAGWMSAGLGRRLGPRASGHGEERESVPPTQLPETLGLRSLLYPRPLRGSGAVILGGGNGVVIWGAAGSSLPPVPLLRKH